MSPLLSDSATLAQFPKTYLIVSPLYLLLLFLFFLTSSPLLRTQRLIPALPLILLFVAPAVSPAQFKPTLMNY